MSETKHDIDLRFANEPAKQDPTTDPPVEPTGNTEPAGDANKLNIELMNFLKSEEGKKVALKELSPDIDSRISKGINTFKENYDLQMRGQIDAEVEKLYQERHPGEDPKDKMIRQANEKAEKALQMQERADRGKHLLARSNELGIKLSESLIDLMSHFKTDEGENFLNAFKKFDLDGFERGRNSFISKHGKTPETGDSINGEISDSQLIKAYKEGKITLEEYQRRVNK